MMISFDFKQATRFRNWCYLPCKNWVIFYQVLIYLHYLILQVLKIYPTVPALSVDMFGAIISFGLVELSHIGDYVIVIDTSIYEEEVDDMRKCERAFLLITRSRFI